MTNTKTNEITALAPYLGAIRGVQPLSREVEHALAVRARRGDGAARDALVRTQLQLVVAMARKQTRGTVRLEELIQEGNLGLLRAVEKFDPEAGTRFSTYAAWWIRAYIGKYLKEARSAVRPRSGTVARADLSLDAPANEEGDVSELELLEDDAPPLDEVCASREGDRRVRAALARLRKRVGEVGWDIIQTRLQKDPPDTLAEIGLRWGVSRERIRQIEIETKRFLHGHLEVLQGGDPAREAA
jgi:RNA polymerase primary sigma factor